MAWRVFFRSLGARSVSRHLSFRAYSAAAKSAPLRRNSAADRTRRGLHIEPLSAPLVDLIRSRHALSVAVRDPARRVAARRVCQGSFRRRKPDDSLEQSALRRAARLLRSHVAAQSSARRIRHGNAAESATRSARSDARDVWPRVLHDRHAHLLAKNVSNSADFRRWVFLPWGKPNHVQTGTYIEFWAHSGPTRLVERIGCMGQVIKKTRGGKFIGWYIRWREGKRRICIASKQPTAAEARKMLVQIEARVARGQPGIEEEEDERLELTVEALCEKFLNEFSSPRVKDLERYQKAARYSLKRIMPYLGDVQLATLRRLDIEIARDKLSRRYRGNTVRASLRPLSTALSWAVRRELIDVNPARGLELPRREQSTEHLTAEEAARLLSEAESRARENDDPIWWSRWIAISLALRLGLRRGECFGLRWTDIDFTTRRVTVAKSYHLAPKSNKPRVLPLPSVFTPILQEWQQRCPETKEHLVCPNRNGGKWGMFGTRPMCGLPELLQATGCPPLTRGFHALRHSFASAFVAQGGSLLTLRDLLGHASLEMSLVYSHVSAAALVTDLEKLRF